jgi:aspartyl protease family protein
MRTRFLFAALLALNLAGANAQSVALSGVAGNKALVTIDGFAPRFLSPGQSHQGVMLLGMQGESATVEVNGQKQTLQVGEAPVSVGRGAARRPQLVRHASSSPPTPGDTSCQAARSMAVRCSSW